MFFPTFTLIGIIPSTAVFPRAPPVIFKFLSAYILSIEFWTFFFFFSFAYTSDARRMPEWTTRWSTIVRCPLCHLMPNFRIVSLRPSNRSRNKFCQYETIVYLPTFSSVGNAISSSFPSVLTLLHSRVILKHERVSETSNFSVNYFTHARIQYENSATCGNNGTEMGVSIRREAISIARIDDNSFVVWYWLRHKILL